MKDKLLSIIIVGRNDDYLGNYVYRLQTCLNFLAQNLKSLGREDEVEVVLVDWNSPGDETLADIVRISPEAARIVRFIVVPNDVARARNPLLSFYTTCAVNVGVRRAQGQFIMLADSDSMMTLPSLEALLNVLRGDLPTPWPLEKLIFPVPRHQIPGGVGARKPSVEQWAKILVRIFGSRRKESPGADCLGGYSAAQLMHRSIWHEVGGYNENLDRAWGWSDNELMLRVTQKYNWMDLGYYGVAAFHIEHHAVSVSEHSRDPDSINEMTLTYDRHPSPENWGLANIELEERTIQGVASWRDPENYNAPMRFELHTLESLEEAISGKELKPYLHELRCRYNAGAKFEAWKNDAAGALVALASLETPLSIYYFGPPEDAFVDAILDSAPGAEVYFIQPWVEGDTAKQGITPGGLTSHLNFSGHRGFSRVLSMPAGEAIDAIRKTDPDAQPIELAFIDRTALNGAFEQVFGQALEALAIHGALVLVDRDKRTPATAEETAIFVGRYLAGHQRRELSGDAARRPVFAQSADEASLGEAFEVVALASGAVHVIRRKPAGTMTTQLAAE